MFRSSYAIPLLLTVCLFAFPEMGWVAPAQAAGTLAKGYIAEKSPKPLPPFLFDTDKGQTIDIKSFRGRYVLLNLWATWCPPCVRELPSLDVLATRIDPQKMVVIALNENSNSLATTQSFYQRHSIDHLAVYADTVGRAPALIEARGLPTTVLIDPEGRAIGKVEGDVDWSTDDAVTFLRAQIP